MKLNDMQRAVLRDYADGDFAHHADKDTIEDPTVFGDTLLTFIMIELSTEEDCDDLDTGIQRITSAQDDLTVALYALQHLHAEILSREDSLQEELCA